MSRFNALCVVVLGYVLGTSASLAAPAAKQVGSPSAAARPPSTVAGSPDALPFAMRVAAGSVEIASCAGWGVPSASRCDWGQADRQPLPDDCRALTDLRSQPIELFGGGRAQRITLGAKEAAKSVTCDWHAVVVAERRRAAKEPTPQPYSAPFGKPWVLYSGPIKPVAGPAIRLDDLGAGQTQIVLGEHDPNVQLCKRPALLSPRLLDLQQRRLRRVGYQQVALSEQQSAPSIVANGVNANALSIDLASGVASSAKGAPAFAVDGDINTRWSEGRRGTGKGEYLTLRARAIAPVGGVSFTLRAQSVPRSVWLQTDSQTYKLEFPAESTPDGVSPREVYFELPEAVSTRCLAVSLNEAAVPEGAKDVDVGFAEFVAWSALQSDDLTRYIADLNAPESEVSDAAVDVLVAHGSAAVKPVAQAYPTLSQSGRARSLSLFSRLGCRASDGFAAALASVELDELERAQAGLSACGSLAGSSVSRLLASQLKTKPPPGARRAPKGSAVVSFRKHQRRLLEHLATYAPTALVDLALPYLGKGKRQRRHLLRNALIEALDDKVAREHAVSQLQGQALDVRGAVALVHALASWVQQEPHAQERLLSLLSGPLNLRHRYLLLSPVAQWLSASDASQPRLVQFFRSAMSSKAPLVLQVHATRIAPRAGLQADVFARLSDPQVRVREAAVLNLGQFSAQKLASTEVTALQTLLEEDPWPLVRAEAARVLGASKPPRELSESVAAALAQAAEDDASPSVRRPALYALGARRARTQLPTVRDVFSGDEDPDVRAGAATALGILCDGTQTDALHERALRLRDLTSSRADRVVGRAALSALGRLAPRDLAQRLRPLFAKTVPAAAKQAARQALDHPKPCSAR